MCKIYSLQIHIESLQRTCFIQGRPCYQGLWARGKVCAGLASSDTAGSTARISFAPVSLK